MAKVNKILLALPFSLLPALLPAQQTVHIDVHVNQVDGVLKPVWANVGHDEPNYTYSPEGRDLLHRLGAIAPHTFRDRTHNLLTTGDGVPALKWGSTNAYTEDAAGKPVYDWTIVDRIFDTYKTAGVIPYVEIGFMPKALSTHPQPYQGDWPKGPLFTGWTYPPTHDAQWSELVYRWAQHSRERYGSSRAQSWDWEVWNEPDIGYWHGTLEQYERLYDFSAAGVKRALPNAPVGGPASTGPASPHAAAFLRGFLTHCVSGTNNATGKTGSPLNFISFHAKGQTRMVEGHAQMDIRRQLADISQGFSIVAGYPTLRHLPIVISESDPEGCAACAASLHPENAYRNTAQYASYEAELLADTLELAARYKVNVQGYVTWAFTFPGQPYFYGYRSLATHDIDKPVMNAFKMFGMLQEQRVQATSSGRLGIDALMNESARSHPDIGVIATRGRQSATMLVWNYDDTAVAAAPAQIHIVVDGLPQSAHTALIAQYRIDDEHSNAYTAWQSMGSPQNPTPQQIQKLKSAGRLQLLSSPQATAVHAGDLDMTVTLPRQGLSLIRLSWQKTP
jgi:xylan 1,4-beta-xylosidase